MQIMQTEAHVKKRLKEKFLPSYKGRISWFWPAASVYGRRGQPDLIINANGIFLAVEVKSPKKGAILDPHQELVKKEIEAANGLYCIVSDEKTLELLQWLIEKCLRHIVYGGM